MDSQARTADGWAAKWIWYPGETNAVNFHLFARKAFDLPAPASEAVIAISAFTDYRLFVNGEHVARGPLPTDTPRPSYDSHDLAGLLRPGANVIGVLAYNYGIGTHWRHKGPGGLIAQLDVRTPQGAVAVCTDETWKVRRAECFRPNSPRVFWSAGFMETFDFGRFERGWLDAAFDDRCWEAPEVLAPRPSRPWLTLEPREVPLLRQQFVGAAGIEAGRFDLSGPHAVGFGRLLPPGRAGLVYAETVADAADAADAIVRVICDDAFKAFLNGRCVLEQNYSEQFARTRVWRGLDEYDQVHYGMTGEHRPAEAAVGLAKGANRLTLAVDQGPGGWGFVLMLLQPHTGRPLDLPFCSPGGQAGRWTIAGPFETTGMNDSLDHAAASLADLPPAAAAAVDPFRYDEVTDVGTLLASENRSAFARADAAQPVVLSAGRYCIVDLGDVWAGHPALCIDSPGEAVLDVGYGTFLADDRRLRFCQGGMLRCADRVYAAAGRQEWQPLHRRAGRYIHVSCRKGRNVSLSGLGMHAVGYPVEEVGRFECSDDLLNRIWQVSRHTTRLLMQHGYQDCLRREQDTLNSNSFNYASRAAACCFGDTLLARRALRTAILTQHDDGWFHGQGVSSPNRDDVTECLWWAVFLRDYLLWSADHAFAADVYPRLEDNLRFFSKMINRHGLIDGRNTHLFRPGQLVYIDDSCSYMQGESYTDISLLNSEIFGLNVLFYAALESAAVLGERLGLDDRAACYRKRAERVRHSCNERFWDADRGLYAEWIADGVRCDRHHPVVQIVALYFGLCDADRRRRILDYLVNTLGLPDEAKPDWPLRTCGIYYYFAEVLFRHGHETAALNLIRKYHGSWVAAGGTAFPEFYRPGEHNVGGRLDHEYEVHGYGTSAHLHFYTNILGVQPVEPGFATVRLAPRPGDLDRAAGRLATPAGTIDVAWHAAGDALSLTAELPPSCCCQLDLPARFTRPRVSINGRQVLPAR